MILGVLLEELAGSFIIWSEDVSVATGEFHVVEGT
jgi:hypothetical protein